jgi:hypothetical protein
MTTASCSWSLPVSTTVIVAGHHAAAPIIGDFMLRREDAWAQLDVAHQARNTQLELGWVLDPVYTGHGYATEAIVSPPLLLREARRAPGHRELFPRPDARLAAIAVAAGPEGRVSREGELVKTAIQSREGLRSEDRESCGPAGAYVGVASCTSPVWYASTTAWTRSRRPSFWRMCVTCVLTVVSLM